MVDIDFSKQQLGTNDEAKNVLSEAFNDYFPTLEHSHQLSDIVYSTFYEYLFGYVYNYRRWKSQVTALCRKWHRLPDLVNLFEQVGGTADGTFREQWGGNDIETFQDDRQATSKKTTSRGGITADTDFTDNLMRQTETRFSGVSPTDSESLNNRVIDSPTEGANTQKTTQKTTFDGDDVEQTETGWKNGANSTKKTLDKGTNRTYSDGRSVAQRLSDSLAAVNPIEGFIADFGKILIDKSICPEIYLQIIGAY